MPKKPARFESRPPTITAIKKHRNHIPMLGGKYVILSTGLPGSNFRKEESAVDTIKMTVETELDGYCPYSKRLEYIHVKYSVFKNLGSADSSVMIHSMNGCSRACPDCRTCPIIRRNVK